MQYYGIILSNICSAYPPMWISVCGTPSSKTPSQNNERGFCFWNNRRHGGHIGCIRRAVAAWIKSQSATLHGTRQRADITPSAHRVGYGSGNRLYSLTKQELLSWGVLCVQPSAEGVGRCAAHPLLTKIKPPPPACPCSPHGHPTPPLLKKKRVGRSRQPALKNY